MKPRVREQVLIDALTEHGNGPVSSHELADIVNMKGPTVYGALRRLAMQGKVLKTGVGAGTRYTLGFKTEHIEIIQQFKTPDGKIHDSHRAAQDHWVSAAILDKAKEWCGKFFNQPHEIDIMAEAIVFNRHDLVALLAGETDGETDSPEATA